MVPPAPGRFSTTIGWPTCFDTCSSTMRPTMSFAAPAANGTIAWMVRSGQGCVACATAADGAARNKAAATCHARNFIRRILPWSLGSLPVPRYRTIIMRKPHGQRSAVAARAIVRATLTQQARWWHVRAADLPFVVARADEDVSCAFFHVVERSDVRHAAVDFALWRVRR